jgi:hypothetical protein
MKEASREGPSRSGLSHMERVLRGKLVLSPFVLCLSWPPENMTEELDPCAACDGHTFHGGLEESLHMTMKICLTQSMTYYEMAAIVMVCSVELGSISPAIWT